uniref:Putative secreted protein n=1 Tax=Anopheles triannulatus TaxID=58253 RepID=A0A2M4B5Y8_9DIPT
MWRGHLLLCVIDVFALVGRWGSSTDNVPPLGRQCKHTEGTTICQLMGRRHRPRKKPRRTSRVPASTHRYQRRR